MSKGSGCTCGHSNGGWCSVHGLLQTVPTIATGNSKPATLQGWECPKCHAVMGPFVSACVNCKGTK